MLLCIERLTGLGRTHAAGVPLPVRMTRIVVTFVLVSLGWVLFRARGFHDALATYASLLSIHRGVMTLGVLPFVLTALVLIATTAILLATSAPRSIAWARLSPSLQDTTIALLLFVYQFYAQATATTPFIYFKF